MRKLQEMAADVKTKLQAGFSTVRISSAQMSEQLLSEIQAINIEKLPAAILVFQDFSLYNENSMRDVRFGIAIVDRFRADSEKRAVSALEAVETFFTIFPERGSVVQQVCYVPENCTAAALDSKFLCFAVGMIARQGTN